MEVPLARLTYLFLAQLGEPLPVSAAALPAGCCPVLPSCGDCAYCVSDTVRRKCPEEAGPYIRLSSLKLCDCPTLL